MFYTLIMLKPKQSNLSQMSARGYLIILVVALAVYAVSAYIASEGAMGSAETAVFNKIYNLPHLPSVIGLAITQLGSAWFLITLVAVSVVNRAKDLAIKISVAGLVTYFMVELSKNLVGRPRPEFILPNTVALENYVTGLGFPSGHTALITVLGFIIYPYVPKKWRVLVPIVVLLVGMSRIYLGVHAPLDVVGGFAVGTVAGMSYYLGARLAKHRRIAKAS